MNTLVEGGYFGYYPWTPPIGYMFRGTDVPKVIFVFTNEFDNHQYRTYSSKTNTLGVRCVVAVP